MRMNIDKIVEACSLDKLLLRSEVWLQPLLYTCGHVSSLTRSGDLPAPMVTPSPLGAGSRECKVRGASLAGLAKQNSYTNMVLT